jgi:hypothetical protein
VGIAIYLFAHLLSAVNENHCGLYFAHSKVDLREFLIEETKLLCHDTEIG